MRILIISNLLPPRVLGGYEIACLKLALGLRARGHEVLLLTSPTELAIGEPQDFVERSLSMVAFEQPEATEHHMWELGHFQAMVSQPENTRQVLVALRRFRPDQVIAFNLVGIGGLAILELLNAAGVPWTLNLGDRVPNAMTEGVAGGILALYGFDDRGAGYRSGSHAVVSQTLADEIAAGGIDLGERIAIIPRGVSALGITRTVPYRSGGTTRFVAAGAIAEHKGVGLIIDAAALLVARGVIGFTVTVYGEGEREHFTAMAATVGLSAIVEFPGHVDQGELSRAESSSDAFLFPTLSREPFGSAPLEAAAVGCVPILTGTAGAAERLVDGIDCVKIDRTAEALADAMERVVAGDIDLETLGAAGIRHAAGALSFDSSVIELEEFIGAVQRPGWADRELDSSAFGAARLALSSQARAALFADSAAADRAREERASATGRLRAVARGVGDLAAGAARSARRRAGGGEADAAAVSAESERVVSLQTENSELQKENAALRHQLGWSERAPKGGKKRRV